ncbi:DUF397 domain-containing protein, partial [Streptomyces sp. 24-1644]|uniref:DUF397 domain-containing protein n=1 Tax=Streptomyces sp. 24-1644 TaxID=3457315 RepID=UPI003FA6F15F
MMRRPSWSATDPFWTVWKRGHSPLRSPVSSSTALPETPETESSVPILVWQKSSHSAEAANCVCLAVAPDGTIRLRDSKAPATVVATTPQALRRFL